MMKTVCIYGFVKCSLTERLIERCQNDKLPYKFIDVNDEAVLKFLYNLGHQPEHLPVVFIKEGGEQRFVSSAADIVGFITVEEALDELKLEGISNGVDVSL